MPEPLGGAHRDAEAMAKTLKKAINATLGQLCSIPLERLLEQRYEKLLSFGEYEEQA